MPYVIERPIVRGADKLTGLPFVRVEVPLTVLGGPGVEADYAFVFDTGCAMTTVGEDVATALGLQSGGKPVGVTGSTGKATGRLVAVRFRFPEETDDRAGVVVTRQGLEVFSTWVVLPRTAARPRLALLGFYEVHQHFAIQTTDANMYFCRWADVPSA